MKKLLLCVFLIMFLIVMNLSAVEASAFRDTLSFIKNNQSVDFSIDAEIFKLPQFSEERTEHVNRLLKHFSLKGSVDDKHTEVSLFLDGDALFSYMELYGTGTAKSVIYTDPEHYCSINDYTGFFPDERSSVGHHLDSVYQMIGILDTLDEAAVFVSRMPSFFPEKTNTVKTQTQTFRDYGKTVKKTTITLTGEELNDFYLENFGLFPFSAISLPSDRLYFEGRQSITLYLTEDDIPVMIYYSGRAGFHPDDIRTVRIDWKTVRKESLEKDELQIRTPNINGTKRNNVLLSYVWNNKGEGNETVEYSVETDTVENGLRTRAFSELSLNISEGIISGSYNDKVLSGGITHITERIISASVPSEGRCNGTLEINHKNDKIEKDHFLLRFDLSPGIFSQVSSIQPDFNSAEGDSFSDFFSSLYAGIIRKVLMLPEEDIILIKEGIPDELWQTVFPYRND